MAFATLPKEKSRSKFHGGRPLPLLNKFHTQKTSIMKNAQIEFHADHALLTILTDEITDELAARLSKDGWDVATNGYKENGNWYTIYVKFM
jgi:hypothetical protein